jgi:hypothetical protein
VRADKTGREREAAVAVKVLWCSFLGWRITRASRHAATSAVLSKVPSMAFYGLLA